MPHNDPNTSTRMISLRRSDSGYLPVNRGGKEPINTDEPIKLPVPETADTKCQISLQ